VIDLLQLLQHFETLFLVLLLGHPEAVAVLRHLRQNSTADEDHVLASRWILNTYFEFLQNIIIKDIIKYKSK